MLARATASVTAASAVVAATWPVAGVSDRRLGFVLLGGLAVLVELVADRRRRDGPQH